MSTFLSPPLLGATFPFQDGKIDPYLIELWATAFTFYLALNSDALISDLNKGICDQELVASQLCHLV